MNKFFIIWQKIYNELFKFVCKYIDCIEYSDITWYGSV